jgi:hypothetical protein
MSSIPDPEPDPYGIFFGLLDPDPGGYLYGSGSFYHQARIVRKTIIPTVL